MFVYFNVLGHRFRHFYIRPRLATRKDEKAGTGILYADLEMDQLVEQGQLIDANGHYARPDVLSLRLDATRKQRMRIESDDEGAPSMKADA